MKQEYWLVLIVGLLLAAYALEAITHPLTLNLATPYHYIEPETLKTYPFTTTVIAVRAIGLYIVPLWLMSFIEKKYPLKAGVSLVLAALAQLYVLQELATGSKILPLEWSLALALTGLALLPTMIIYFLKGGISKAHEKLVSNDSKESAEEESEEAKEKED